jgi:hypothetical protein
MNFLAAVVPEHRLVCGPALEALVSPCPQDIVPDTLLEVRYAIRRAIAHGFPKSLAAVHNGAPASDELLFYMGAFEKQPPAGTPCRIG